MRFDNTGTELGEAAGSVCADIAQILGGIVIEAYWNDPALTVIDGVRYQLVRGTLTCEARGLATFEVQAQVLFDWEHGQASRGTLEMEAIGTVYFELELPAEQTDLFCEEAVGRLNALLELQLDQAESCEQSVSLRWLPELLYDMPARVIVLRRRLKALNGVQHIAVWSVTPGHRDDVSECLVLAELKTVFA